MPIKHATWTVGDKPAPLAPGRPATLIGRFLVLSLTTICGCGIPAVTGVAATPSVAEVQLFVQLLQEIHFRGATVPRARYDEAIPEFMEELDPAHMVFRDTDRIELVARYGTKLYDEMQTHGRIDAAVGIFERYAAHANTRAAWIADTLSREIEFTGEEDVATSDRPDTAWPQSTAEADGLWDRRLRGEVLNEILNGRTPTEARRRVQRRYEDWIAAVNNRDHRDLNSLFLTAVCRLYDARTSYWPAEMFKSFARDTAPGFAGIGAIIEKRGDSCFVQELLPNGAAERSASMQCGDRILAVGPTSDDLVDVTGWRLVQVIDRLKGNAGTRVAVEVQPAAAPDPSIRETVELTREMAGTYPTRAHGGIVSMLDSGGGSDARWGLVTLRTIYGTVDDSGPEDQKISASLDVGRLIQRLEAEHVRGIVLDLRGNVGGLLGEAVDVAGVFIGQSTIVQTKNFSGKVKATRPTSAQSRYTGPLIILVNHATSAGAEIIAGAVQDYGRGIIVGPGATKGNGTVQAFLELDMYLPARTAPRDAGALRLTVQVLYRPNGASIQTRGITPDILLRCSTEPPAAGDPLARRELPWDQIDPVPRELAPFDPTRLVELRRQSEARQGTLNEFARVRRVVDRLNQLRQDARSFDLEQRQKVRADYAALLPDIQAASAGAAAALTITPIYLDEDDSSTKQKRSSDPFHATVDLLEAMRVLADVAGGSKP